MDERDGKVVGWLNVSRAKKIIDTELWRVDNKRLNKIVGAQFDLLVKQIETLNKIVVSQRETINQLNGFEEEQCQNS
jgi:hypothetical protein